MENASKALLIAAAVLVAIVIIALGIVLIKDTGNTSKKIDETGNLLKESTKIASGNARGAMKGLIISKEKFNVFLEDFYSNKNSREIMQKLGLRQELLPKQIELIGWQWIGNDYTKISSDYGFPLEENFPNLSRNELTEKRVTWCQENSNSLIKLTDPENNDKRREECKKLYYKFIDEDPELKNTNTRTYEEYEEKCINSKSFNYMHPMRASFFWSYDDTGYIDKVYYVSGLIWYKSFVRK